MAAPDTVSQLQKAAASLDDTDTEPTANRHFVTATRCEVDIPPRNGPSEAAWMDDAIHIIGALDRGGRS